MWKRSKWWFHWLENVEKKGWKKSRRRKKKRSLQTDLLNENEKTSKKKKQEKKVFSMQKEQNTHKYTLHHRKGKKIARKRTKMMLNSKLYERLATFRM